MRQRVALSTAEGEHTLVIRELGEARLAQVADQMLASTKWSQA